MTNKEYEILYILKDGLSESEIKESIKHVNEIFKDSEEEQWGYKDLAYPIKKNLRGYYVLNYVKADSNQLKKFTNMVRLEKNYLRHLVISLEKEKISKETLKSARKTEAKND